MIPSSDASSRAQYQFKITAATDRCRSNQIVGKWTESFHIYRGRCLQSIPIAEWFHHIARLCPINKCPNLAEWAEQNDGGDEKWTWRCEEILETLSKGWIVNSLKDYQYSCQRQFFDFSFWKLNVSEIEWVENNKKKFVGKITSTNIQLEYNFIVNSQDKKKTFSFSSDSLPLAKQI